MTGNSVGPARTHTVEQTTAVGDDARLLLLPAHAHVRVMLLLLVLVQQTVQRVRRRRRAGRRRFVRGGAREPSPERTHFAISGN